MVNLIETKWGLIEERERNPNESNALVCIDPGKNKPGEWHQDRTETFHHRFGYGFILVGNEARELREGGKPITVNPGEVYQIHNLGEEADPLCFLVNVKPPFDPSDVYLVS